MASPHAGEGSEKEERVNLNKDILERAVVRCWTTDSEEGCSVLTWC